MKSSMSAAAILYQLEHPEIIDANKPKIPTRQHLCRTEEKAWSKWKLPPEQNKSAASPSNTAPSKTAKFSRSASSLERMPGEASDLDEDSGTTRPQLMKDFPKGVEIELHRRGFGISSRRPLEFYLGVNKQAAGMYLKYDTHEVGGMTWDKNGDVSNPAQKQLSQHKTPKRVIFGKPRNSGGARKQLLSEAPGPGHYHAPDLWDPNWQHYPTLGSSFVRKPPRPGESRFGGLARGLVRSGKGDMELLAN